MTVRTSKKTAAFGKPFVLDGLDEILAAGAFGVGTDEELLEGISFPADRRIMTLNHLHPRSDRPGITHTMTIDPIELEAALERDRVLAETSVGECLQSSEAERQNWVATGIGRPSIHSGK
ncbi:MAG: hypothetical protein GY791_05870 [Alphaproteobacteria bacterium]|nr:hypothetical protein [Alphaproteobacteria bacterium]